MPFPPHHLLPTGIDNTTETKKGPGLKWMWGWTGATGCLSLAQAASGDTTLQNIYICYTDPIIAFTLLDYLTHMHSLAPTSALVTPIQVTSDITKVLFDLQSNHRCSALRYTARSSSSSFAPHKAQDTNSTFPFPT